MKGETTGRDTPADADATVPPNQVPAWFRRRVGYVIAAVAGALVALVADGVLGISVDVMGACLCSRLVLAGVSAVVSYGVFVALGVPPRAGPTAQAQRTSPATSRGTRLRRRSARSRDPRSTLADSRTTGTAADDPAIPAVAIAAAIRRVL